MEDFKLARRATKVSARTVNAELASLQAILSYARRIGVPCSEPTFAFLRAVKSKRAKPWSHEELARLFRAAQEEAPFLVPLSTFLVNTGCRKTEALHVTWEHIDFERGLVRIWPSAEWRPKDDEPREIPMSDTLRAMLRSLERRSPYVCPSSAGQRHASWPKRSFDRVRTLAGRTGGPHTGPRRGADGRWATRSIAPLAEHEQPLPVEATAEPIENEPAGPRVDATIPDESRRGGGVRSLPEPLPANDLGVRACARTPKKVPSSRLVTGLDVPGIEPGTSRVRF